MEKTLLLLLIPFLLSCSNSKKAPPKPFTTGMLTAQLFSVNPSRDTTLTTLHGSLIRIKAGSFEMNEVVQVEIKEAFAAAEILAAGLATESNGRLLRSGGMIYINATVDGDTAQLLKPINVSIPNTYYDSAMQVFKGVMDDSNNINWVDPQPVDSTKQSAQWEKGKTLFRSLCMSCHAIFKNRTGPALKALEYRGPWTDRKYIYAYVRNPGAFIAKDTYTRQLLAQYRSVMTGFPALTDEMIDAILNYIKNESARPDAMREEQTYLDTMRITPLPPPCGDTIVYLPVPRSELAFLEETTPAQAPAAVDTANFIDTVQTSRPEDLQVLRRGFTDRNPTSGMYDFEIKTLGWYNIDALVEGYAGTSNVKLWVQLQVDFEINLHIYLFCPRNKMLSVMNEKRDGKYYFNKINDGIPLFLNDRAIIFAFGSKDEKLYYGISEFSIQHEQTVTVTIKETSEEEIRKALYAKEMDGIDLGIEKKERKNIHRPCKDSVQSITDSLVLPSY